MPNLKQELENYINKKGKIIQKRKRRKTKLKHINDIKAKLREAYKNDKTYAVIMSIVKNKIMKNYIDDIELLWEFKVSKDIKKKLKININSMAP